MAARHARNPALSIWMNGEFIGRWGTDRKRGQTFSYDRSWLNNPLSRPLSLSLPLEQGTKPATGPVVEAFFENLLPDNAAIRKRIAAKFGVGTTAVDLLEQIGRDCAGAIQILPEGDAPQDIRTTNVTPLSNEAIEQLLDRTVADPAPGFATEDELRISIAGAQEKSALTWHEGRWCLPHGSTPTTHIFKLPLGLVGGMQADFSTSVENEWLCSRVAQAYGLPTARCDMGTFGRHKVLIVERFDRKLIENSWWVRLPQEDFCQALGVPPEKKYERDGGPGMLQILKLLRGSDNAEIDRKRFLMSQLLFWALAAPDGHAKNFSIFLEAAGRYRSTPLYDILSAWPVIGGGANQFQWQKVKLAMAVHSSDSHYKMAEIQRRHWNALANSSSIGVDFEPELAAFISTTSDVVSAVGASLPEGFPDVVSESIFRGLERQVKHLSEYN